MRIITQLATVLLLFLMIFTQSMSKTPDPYKVLGIRREATQDDIRQAFKKRSKKYHPDINKEDPRAKEKFAKVVNAYQLLKDPQRRKMYDLTGTDDPNAQGGAGFGGFGGFGGFPGGFGINIEDLMNMGFGGGHHQGGGRQGRGGGGGGSRTYTFTFGGGGGPGAGGFRFEM